MTLAAPIAQALAYVDGCLPADQRREFERSLAADKALAARLEQWRLQNEAILRTFGDKVLEAGRGVAERASAPAPGDLPPLARDLPQRRESLGRDLRAQVIAPREGSRIESPTGRRLAQAIAAPILAVLAVALSAAPAPLDPSPQLSAAAFSAYRTYVAAAQMEFATADAAALERWLRPQIGGWVAIPNLAAAGFALAGGRVVSGAQGPAGFALYKNSAGARVGLTLESGEAPPGAARASGALVAAPLAAPALEEATLVAAASVDLAHLAESARFPGAPGRSPTP